MNEINKLKIIYFLSYSIYGVVLPFLPLILTDKGLDISSMSFAFLGFGVSAMITPLIVAHFADRKFPWRILMSSLLITTGLIAQTWHFELSKFSFLISIFIFFSFYLPSIGLLDTFTFKIIKKQNKKIEFSSLRIYGSIGFLIPTVVSFFLSYYQNINSYFLINQIGVLGLISGLSALLLPQVELTNRTVDFPIIPAFKSLISKPLRSIYIGTSLTLVGLNFFYTLSPIYLKELDFSTLEIGLILNFAVIAEILFMPLTGWYINKFGIRTVILFAILAVVLRLIILSTFTNTILITLIQALHAPTIIGFFVAGTFYIISKASHDSQFSIQAIYTSTQLGLSRIISILLIITLFKITPFDNLTNIKIIFLIGSLISLTGAIFLFVDKKT